MTIDWEEIMKSKELAVVAAFVILYFFLEYITSILGEFSFIFVTLSGLYLAQYFANKQPGNKE